MSNSETRRGRPPEADAEARRASVIAAARRRFADVGYKSASLKGIAAEAGLTTPALYHYFASKRDLFLAVYAATDAELLEELRLALAGISGIRSQLAALAKTARELHGRDASIAGFMSVAQIEARRLPELSGGDKRFGRGRIGGAIIDLLEGLVETAVERGELDAGVDVRAFVELLLATTLGIALFATIVDPERGAAIYAEWARFVDGSVFVAAEGSAPAPRGLTN